MRKEKILVIDDDEIVCEAILFHLNSMGYEAKSVNTGIEGLKLALSDKYDMVVLDVVLPEIDGFELLRELRKESEVPVLMLTTQDEEAYKVVGLELGADDYIAKPFSPKELLARIRAILRRYRLPPKDESYFEEKIQHNGLCIFPDSHEAKLDDALLDLTPVEYCLLSYLVERSGKVISRQQLLDHISGRDYEVFDRAIDMHISTLRKKLGDKADSPRFIKTIRGSGYMLI